MIVKYVIMGENEVMPPGRLNDWAKEMSISDDWKTSTDLVGMILWKVRKSGVNLPTPKLKIAVLQGPEASASWFIWDVEVIPTVEFKVTVPNCYNITSGRLFER